MPIWVLVPIAYAREETRKQSRPAGSQPNPTQWKERTDYTLSYLILTQLTAVGQTSHVTDVTTGTLNPSHLLVKCLAIAGLTLSETLKVLSAIDHIDLKHPRQATVLRILSREDP